MNNIMNDFGSLVFNDTVMMERLPHATYKSLRRSIDLALPLDPEIAAIVATVMKDWAIENGATHFTHWFQPMTGITAGKHESFISPQKNDKIILEFSGKELIKGEPDASSFPNGGLRNTFEARGYTAWDCTSPAFIRGNSLYIPTAFCSYNGEALDAKTPLLRSMEVLSEQAMRILKLFGNTTTTHVIPTVGAEQEYFLIDRETYEQRLDLKICGRTLFGTKPPKGQEMDDHYCGRIRIRIAEYMKQLDEVLWKLGVPSKTKHNEVAPAQHELAPIFESCNVATDHNQLIMEMMRVIAKKNHLACLLHEKPFAHVNGSGKHNNWSMSTNDGVNLFDPGNTPYENIQFLIFLCAVIRSVSLYPELLRMTTASAGNDWRLGAQEAPPHIISIFLGEHLTKILFAIAQGNNQQEDEDISLELKTNVSTLPSLPKDDTDRNRTSPFAFTGNKFEFRMIGSASSIATANFVINTIVADSLKTFADILENSNDFDASIQKIISDTVKEHGKVIFNGNGYTKEWAQKAKELGLPDIPDTVEAAKAYLQSKNIALFEKFGILTSSGCQARYEIMLERFSKTIHIEAHTMIEMVRRHILPALIKYAGMVGNTVEKLDNVSLHNDYLLSHLTKLSQSISDIAQSTEILENQMSYADEGDFLQQAIYYRDKVLAQMEKLRHSVDEIEGLVGKKYWPIPNCTDLLHRI